MDEEFELPDGEKFGFYDELNSRAYGLMEEVLQIGVRKIFNFPLKNIRDFFLSRIIDVFRETKDCTIYSQNHWSA